MYAFNSREEFKNDSEIILINQPWYLSITEWLYWNVVSRICDFVPMVQYHFLICDKLFKWIYQHPKRVEKIIKINYNTIKELFPEDEEFFYKHEKM